MHGVPHRFKQFAITYKNKDSATGDPLPTPDELLRIYWSAIYELCNGFNGRRVWQLQTREALDSPISPGVYGRYIKVTAHYGPGMDPETGQQREYLNTAAVSFSVNRTFFRPLGSTISLAPG